MYILRERPQKAGRTLDDHEKKSEELEGGLLGLPETETELGVGDLLFFLLRQLLNEVRTANLI